MVILMAKKLPRLIGKKAAGWQALPSSIQIFYNFQTFKLSQNLALIASGLEIWNPTNFMTPFPFQLSISNHDHLLWLTRSRDMVIQRAYFTPSLKNLFVWPLSFGNQLKINVFFVYFRGLSCHLLTLQLSIMPLNCPLVWRFLS